MEMPLLARAPIINTMVMFLIIFEKIKLIFTPIIVSDIMKDMAEVMLNAPLTWEIRPFILFKKITPII
jgi:hypothetical protein